MYISMKLSCNFTYVLWHLSSEQNFTRKKMCAIIFPSESFLKINIKYRTCIHIMYVGCFWDPPSVYFIYANFLSHIPMKFWDAQGSLLTSTKWRGTLTYLLFFGVESKIALTTISRVWYVYLSTRHFKIILLILKYLQR